MCERWYLAMLKLSLILWGERLPVPPVLPNTPQFYFKPLYSLKSFPETLNSCPLKRQLNNIKPANKCHNYTSVYYRKVFLFICFRSVWHYHKKKAFLKISPTTQLHENYLWHPWWNIKANLSSWNVCYRPDLRFTMGRANVFQYEDICTW